MNPSLIPSDPPLRRVNSWILALVALFLIPGALEADPTKLLRQPSLVGSQIAFAHGGDLWVVGADGGEARRLTSTPAVESEPHLSPDGTLVTFSSNRSGDWAVYVMPVAGGDATRLTWYPAPAQPRGWTPDGSRIVYASTRGTAPTSHDRLWTVAPGGGPSQLLPAPMGHRGWHSPDGERMVVEPISRWDEEWRGYRGGQNTSLVLLDLESLDEVLLPNPDRSADVHPVWLEDKVYFLSDRDWVSNIWSYEVTSGDLEQVTHFRELDVKSLNGHGSTLVFEQDGAIHVLDTATGTSRQPDITVRGDFPWAMPHWVDASSSIQAAGLSPTGQRAVMQARGEIFTVPAEHGDVRNLTGSSTAADRAPVWSPDGSEVAWFSDDGSGYRLLIAAQDGLSDPRSFSLGESKLAWAPAWSPDGTRIAWVDDRLRIQVMHLETEQITTVDADGILSSKTAPGPVWSPDSRWLAYAKSFPNHFRRIVVWSVDTEEAHPVTDAMAHAISPSWDRDGRHLWFLASTDLGRAAGWANTSSMGASPTFAAYLVVLRGDDSTPFTLRSDEEPTEDAEEGPARNGQGDGGDDASPEEGGTSPGDGAVPEVRIDFTDIQRRIVALPMPVRSYATAQAGPAGSVFLGEQVPNQQGVTLHKFTLEERESTQFAQGVNQLAVSGDGSRILLRSGSQWRIVDTARPPDATGGRLDVQLQARIDPRVEWRQIFQEAWRYQRDYLYDPNTHGADWDAVWARYEPLVDHVQHRTDLTYLLDQVNGELSVGHSFVGGGDLPSVDPPRSAALGADLETHEGRWRISRIYTHESWNPNLRAPLDRPGARIQVGHYLLAVNGQELTASDDPYRLLEGTRDRQTALLLNGEPRMEGAWTETVTPTGSENALRQRAWVEDNRRRVDELSGGRLAYVWVPNTGGPGVVSFDRYYFSQQDRHGAVIDERFNGGGLLDDYMVDLMNRERRAAITNEAAGGRPMQLPAGVLGPKVLLINEMAGSGGDYFPWIFRKLEIGPLIGTRTWGGLVASCAPVPMVDGGFVTAPCNAVFEPGVGWVAENEGVPPDMEVRIDARSWSEGRDVQLERGVEETLRLLEEAGVTEVEIPPYPRPARRPGNPG